MKGEAVTIKPNTTLREWLDALPASAQSLSWCHTTDAWTLQKIIECGELQPRPCRVLARDLLYLFYGRPAFRHAERKLAATAMAPVVIALWPPVADDAVAMFPFDTGAYCAGRYERWLHPGMALADFELTPCSDSARRHIGAFFGSNRNYWNCRAVTVAPRVPGIELLIDALHGFLVDPDAAGADDRRHCVEAQLGRSVPFNDATVRAVILPSVQMDTHCVRALREGAGSKIQWIGYELNRYKPAREYQVLLEDKARGMQAAEVDQ